MSLLSEGHVIFVLRVKTFSLNVIEEYDSVFIINPSIVDERKI